MLDNHLASGLIVDDRIAGMMHQTKVPALVVASIGVDVVELQFNIGILYEDMAHSTRPAVTPDEVGFGFQSALTAKFDEYFPRKPNF